MKLNLFTLSNVGNRVMDNTFYPQMMSEHIGIDPRIIYGSNLYHNFYKMLCDMFIFSQEDENSQIYNADDARRLRVGFYICYERAEGIWSKCFGIRCEAIRQYRADPFVRRFLDDPVVRVGVTDKANLRALYEQHKNDNFDDNENEG